MKAFKENPKRATTISVGLIMMALATAISTMLNSDEVDKRILGNLSPEELTRALYVPNPFGSGFVRIRIPEQIGAITGLAYLYVIQHYGGNKATFEDYMKTVTSAVPRQLNVTQPDEMVFAWTPQVMKPTIEVATNTRTFPNLMPIEPDWMREQYAPEDRYRDYTSYFAKKLGQWAKLSPTEIEYFVKAQFGVVGNFLMGAGDFVQGDFKRLERINPLTRNENMYSLMGRAYNHFYDRKEFYGQQYNKLKDEHSFSEEEADRIKYVKGLYDDLGGKITDARALEKEGNLDKEQKLMLWEAILYLEQDKYEEAEDKIYDLQDSIPEKEKRSAKYKEGDEIPRESGSGDVGR